MMSSTPLVFQLNSILKLEAPKGHALETPKGHAPPGSPGGARSEAAAGVRVAAGGTEGSGGGFWLGGA